MAKRVMAKRVIAKRVMAKRVMAKRVMAKPAMAKPAMEHPVMVKRVPTDSDIMAARSFTFVGGLSGPWRITKTSAVTGPSLPKAERLHYLNTKLTTPPADAVWTLWGVTSNERYLSRADKKRLVAKQYDLGTRPENICVALIPVRKKPEWWDLTQDERLKIVMETSEHNEIGLEYLPEITRRLHHCRDGGEPQPFDFLTWFDYQPKDADKFEELVQRLRATEEWKYVDREVDIRAIADGKY